jgi:hypothetical protein
MLVQSSGELGGDAKVVALEQQQPPFRRKEHVNELQQ